MTVNNTFSDSMDSQLSILMGVLAFALSFQHTDSSCTCLLAFAAALSGLVTGLHAMHTGRSGLLTLAGLALSAAWFLLFFAMMAFVAYLSISF